MGIVLSIVVFIVSVVVYLLLKGYHEKRKHDQLIATMTKFSDDCSSNHRTTQEIATAFLKASEENTTSLKALHTETLKILTGDRQ